jgi:hypothetical protein
MVDEVYSLADILYEAALESTRDPNWRGTRGPYRDESEVDCMRRSSSSYNGVVRREVCQRIEARRSGWFPRCVNASGAARDSWAK